MSTTDTKKPDSKKYDVFSPRLPEEMNQFQKGVYNRFPAFSLKRGAIQKGCELLVQRLGENSRKRTFIVSLEGYHGIDWDALVNKLDPAATGMKMKHFGMNKYLKPESEIDRIIEPFLGGDDPLFGKRFPLGINVFFDPVKLDELRTELLLMKDSDEKQVIIISGTGSSLIELYDELWYADIPKDVIQLRARQEGLKNIGGERELSFGDYYKRAYFVDWPALNRTKMRLLPSVDVFIDGQNADDPVWMDGEDFRDAVREVSENPFRVRPWFMPGPWGGKFLQGHMDLDPEQPNFAWSYELIVPENSVVLEKDNRRIEWSFDTIMYLENNNILGNEAARLFKYEWPIRLDYLDTVDGGNLSTQCHPRPEYIRRNFGESFTQDETYYITNCKPGARVYLGLTDSCDPDEFKNALERSQKDGSEVDIDKYVYSVESEPHGLYLIPNGTVHCSGRGNLVLEISATPYIFTFKIYDYLRKDLNGALRTLNVERAWDNMYFHRRSEYVGKNLIPSPRLIRDEAGRKEYVLSDSPHFFYNIHRVEFENEFQYETGGKAFAVNLVEGESVEVISHSGHKTILNYLESMVIPAATKRFTVVNRKNRPCKMVLVFIRPGIDRLNRTGDDAID